MNCARHVRSTLGSTTWLGAAMVAVGGPMLFAAAQLANAAMPLSDVRPDLPKDGVRISWLGQSCELVTGGGYRLLVDPAGSQMTGYPPAHVHADFVLVTHQHGDHNAVGDVLGTPTIVRNAGKLPTPNPLDIRAIHAWHDNAGGRERGPDTMFTWTQGGLKFAHLGDLGDSVLSESQAGALANVDVMFVPAGGHFTLEPKEMARLVKGLHPRLIIPMHYKTPKLKPDIPLVDEKAFLAEFKDIVRKGATSPLVTKAALPPTMAVWVLEPVLPELVAATGYSDTSAAGVGSKHAMETKTKLPHGSTAPAGLGKK